MDVSPVLDDAECTKAAKAILAARAG